MIYNINLGIGWASSGVEYAQIYRAKMFRRIQQTAKFIFLDFISSDNIEHLTRNIGFYDEEVIWLYQYFTDVKIAPSTYPLQRILDEMGVAPQGYELQDKYLYLNYDNQLVLRVRLSLVADTIEQSQVESVEWLIKQRLVQKDYYSYTKQFSEYYYEREAAAKLHQRTWFNENGSVAYDEYITYQGEKPVTTLYKFSDKICYTKQEFVAYFLQKLQLTNQDILVIDRDEEIGQEILENKGNAKLICVVHADHFSENDNETHYVLWNNYYEYMFTNAHELDVIVTSTDAQTKLLSEQFNERTTVTPNQIITIPVGSLETLKRPEQVRKPYSLVTASRLASEKHIDWLIRSVVKAKTHLPELTFDIYGMGGEDESLRKLIIELDAGSYIRMMGHHHMAEVYKNYELYIAGSTSEGFGLTLLEAVGSGLGLIGFDVRYGNPTFIRHNKNGYLIPAEVTQEVDVMTTQYAQKIVELFTQHNLADVQQTSYDIATPYLIDTVAKRWEELIYSLEGKRQEAVSPMFTQQDNQLVTTQRKETI